MAKLRQRAASAAAGWYARGFVRWKTRLDRIFGLLLEEDLGHRAGGGPRLWPWRDPRPALRSATPAARSAGCDLDPRRIEAAVAGAVGAGRPPVDERRTDVPVAGRGLDPDHRRAAVSRSRRPGRAAATLRRRARARRAVAVQAARLQARASLRGRRTSWTDCSSGSAARASAPAYQPPETYVKLLVEAGMSVDVRRYRNRLPLAHAFFYARKTGGRG